VTIEFTFIETKSDNSVPFFEHSADFNNHINSTHAKNLISGSFTPVISENGLVRMVKAVFNTPENAKAFDTDSVLKEAAKKSQEYNKAHGITSVSTLLPTPGSQFVRPVQQPQQSQPEEQSGGIVI
jgi:hypothetical protein